jgi:ACR3 family arsenite transporter
MQGETLLSKPIAVVSIAIPLMLYFVIMFSFSFWLSYVTKHNYEESASIAFTASGNNFELAIAVSIGIFGINSGQAFTGVIGPLVEVPALILLVNAAFWFKRKWYPDNITQPA